MFKRLSLAQRMADAHNGTGGQAIYEPVDAFGNEGHGLATRANDAPIRAPLVEKFLKGK
jgi:hypothetical protein